MVRLRLGSCSDQRMIPLLTTNFDNTSSLMLLNFRYRYPHRQAPLRAYLHPHPLGYPYHVWHHGLPSAPSHFGPPLIPLVYPSYAFTSIPAARQRPISRIRRFWHFFRGSRKRGSLQSSGRSAAAAFASSSSLQHAWRADGQNIAYNHEGLVPSSSASPRLAGIEPLGIAPGSSTAAHAGNLVRKKRKRGSQIIGLTANGSPSLINGTQPLIMSASAPRSLPSVSKPAPSLPATLAQPTSRRGIGKLGVKRDHPTHRPVSRDRLAARDKHDKRSVGHLTSLAPEPVRPVKPHHTKAVRKLFRGRNKASGRGNATSGSSQYKPPSPDRPSFSRTVLMDENGNAFAVPNKAPPGARPSADQPPSAVVPATGPRKPVSKPEPSGLKVPGTVRASDIPASRTTFQPKPDEFVSIMPGSASDNASIHLGRVWEHVPERKVAGMKISSQKALVFDVKAGGAAWYDVDSQLAKPPQQFTAGRSRNGLPNAPAGGRPAQVGEFDDRHLPPLTVPLRQQVSA